MPAARGSTHRRRATQEEVSALSSATRLRILRLTLDAPMTNQQLAQRLAINPASALYHVRRLVSAGLLEAQPARPRPSGGFEIPYRSLGRSWTLEVAEADRPTSALLDAFLAEVHEVGPDRIEHATRARAKLTPKRRTELIRRMRELLDEFSNDTSGAPTSMFFAIHPDGERPPSA
jgi:predicted ArsR family transcriptional regulator